MTKLLDRTDYFCARAMAIFIDRCIILVMMSGLEWIFPWFQSINHRLWVPLNSKFGSWFIGIDLSVLFITELPYLTWAVALMFYVAIKKGNTPGMESFELEIWTSDGNRPGYLQVLWRHILSIILAFLPITYLWPFFDPKGRTVHDILSGTVIMRRGSEPGKWRLENDNPGRIGYLRNKRPSKSLP